MGIELHFGWGGLSYPSPKFPKISQNFRKYGHGRLYWSEHRSCQHYLLVVIKTSTRVSLNVYSRCCTYGYRSGNSSDRLRRAMTAAVGETIVVAVPDWDEIRVPAVSLLIVGFSKAYLSG